jgi:hypothetical protein
VTLAFLISTFLGRPWKPYSTIVSRQSYIGDVLSSKRWSEWKRFQNLDRLYYAEYKNYGPRKHNIVIKWQWCHILNDPRQAINFTMSHLYRETYSCFHHGVPFIMRFEDHTYENSNYYYSNVMTKLLVLCVLLLESIQWVFFAVA